MAAAASEARTRHSNVNDQQHTYRRTHADIPQITYTDTLSAVKSINENDFTGLEFMHLEKGSSYWDLFFTRFLSLNMNTRSY